MKVANLSDAQLLESLKSLHAQGRALLARLLAHLVEVEKRGLHLEAACPSMFQFCVRRLGMTLEKQRLGKTSRPRPPREHTDSERVSRATRRAVFEHDGERCTFTDAAGHRCAATTWLELDHVIPRACGGADDAGNLRVRCRGHNLLYAEQTFGKEHVARKIHERGDPRQRRQRESASTSQGCDLAASGLVNMGFRRADVRRALDTVGARHGAEDLTTIPIQTILREALAVLT